jgi:hypothetical protein
MLGGPVPAGPPLFIEFVNTLHWYEGAPIELLGTRAELDAWLAEHGRAPVYSGNVRPAAAAVRRPVAAAGLGCGGVRHRRHPGRTRP